MISRRDPGPPRSGVARPAGRLRLVAALAAASALGVLAARPLSHRSQRDPDATIDLPVLRRESMNVGGPEMAPHTPHHSSRPGTPVTRLDPPTTRRVPGHP